MKRKSRFDVEVKKANILHHNAEAEIFEMVHSEAFTQYERSQILKDINHIDNISAANELCVDVGCGTGLVTSFELSRYNAVVAMDICKRMLKVVKRKFKNFDGLNLLLCDAECLPLKTEIADMVSVSSVLHHLPKPSRSIIEMSRILKTGGFLYIVREPNDVHFRRFFKFLDDAMICAGKFILALPLFRKKREKLNSIKKLMMNSCLNYPEVNVHCLTGFNTQEISLFLSQNHFKVISAYSYHWIFFDRLSTTNFIITKIPFSKKLGRYICCIAKKLPSKEKGAKQMHKMVLYAPAN